MNFKKQKERGFLLIAVIGIVAVLLVLGFSLISNSLADLYFAKKQVERIQAYELARSGLSYYKAYGIPPKENGEPQKLFLFSQKGRYIQIWEEGEVIYLAGVISDGDKIKAKVILKAPLWDPNIVE